MDYIAIWQSHCRRLRGARYEHTLDLAAAGGRRPLPHAGLYVAKTLAAPADAGVLSHRDGLLPKRRPAPRETDPARRQPVDLLRGGERSPLETPLPPAPYYVSLARANNRPYVDVWPIQLEARLPVLPVPLSMPDPDAPLDLGAIVQAVYERGGYATRLDYRQPVPPPSLEAKQQAWVDQLLAESQ